MKKIILLIISLSAIYLIIMAFQPIRLSEESIVQPDQIYDDFVNNQEIDSPLYTCEKKWITNHNLTFLKSLTKKIPIITDYQAFQMGTSKYHIEEEKNLGMDVKGNLFQDVDGNFTVIVTITKPYSFSVGTNQNPPTETVFIDYTPYYHQTTAFQEMYLRFEDGSEYLVGQFYSDNNLLELPVNSYSQYFKSPDIVYSFVYKFQSDPNLPSDYFEFQMTIIQKTEEVDSIMLGFNEFKSQNQLNQYYATSISVAYKEES